MQISVANCSTKILIDKALKLHTPPRSYDKNALINSNNILLQENVVLSECHMEECNIMIER